jgi:short-subunit dehydrogenase
MTHVDLERELSPIQLNVTLTYVLTYLVAQQRVARGRGGIVWVSSPIGPMPHPYFLLDSTGFV